MNKARLVIGTILVIGSAVPAYLDYRRIKSEEIVKREQIAAKLAVDLDAIKRASLKMEQKLKDPNYRPDGVKKVFEDLEFEIIAAHYE